MQSISRNKAFEKDIENGKLSLNLKNTDQYLGAMYRQYTSNSRDIKTPNKIDGINSYKNKKRSNGMKSVLGVGVEDEKNNLQKNNSKIRKTEAKSFNNIKDINSNINTFNIYGEPEKKNIFSKNINENYRVFNFNIQKNNNSDYPNFPEIYFKKLFHDKYIESLKNDGIIFAMKELENYQLTKEKNANEYIKKEIVELMFNIRQFYSKKKLYDRNNSKIEKLQKELFLYYKIMKKNMRIIELETYHIMNYDYDTFISYHELVLKRNALYEDILKEIGENLGDLNKLQKELIDNKNSIIDNIFNIQSINGFNESLFNKKIKLIENELNLSYSPNQLELIEDYDNLSINEIIMRFLEAKKKVIDKINTIYDTMANITVP